MTVVCLYCIRMQAEQHNRVWHWDTARVPRGRRISLTRRCYLDQVIHRAQQQGRLSQADVDVLDFWFGVTTGYAHTLVETGERFGLTPKQIRGIERNIFGEEIAAFREWAKRVLAECYEK